MTTYASAVIPLHIADPGADSTMPKWQVPGDGSKTTIKAATAIVQTTLASGTANFHSLRLLNYGTLGTGVVGTISAVLGGTAAGGTAPGWTAGTPVSFVITDGELDSGQWVAVEHEETGTVAPLNIDINLHVVSGPATV